MDNGGMDQQRVQRRGGGGALRARLAAGAVGFGGALLAIGLALAALTALILTLGALGVSGLGSAPHALSISSAAQDAAVAFYLVQLVGVSFFNGTAELRFAVVPGLLVVGLSIIAATVLSARITGGRAGRKLRVALSLAIPYALLSGLGAVFVPLHLDAPTVGAGIAVSPSPVEAFLLPLGWGLLFASLGGLIGIHGRRWGVEVSRALGAWTAPLTVTLRVLGSSLALCTILALVVALSIAGWGPGSLVGGGIVHSIRILGAAVIALPTMAAAVLVSGFSVPFDWHLDALSHGAGSLSAFGGSLPSTDPSHGRGAPAVLELAPLISLAAVFAIGWLSARRSGADPRTGLANLTRAAALITVAIWLLALLARVDVQAGGLLGFHLRPDGAALLWRVPLLSFVGCFAGGVAAVLSRGRLARSRLRAALRDELGAATARPTPTGWVDRAHRGLASRATAGLAFAAVPVLLVALGPTAGANSPTPAKVSYAPIARDAEETLESDSTSAQEVSVTVDPTTRVINTATVHIPVSAVNVAAGRPPVEKAKAVLREYGDLFGLSSPASELGRSEVATDQLGMTHVYFDQMAGGVPIFGRRIAVHFTPGGKYVTSVMGSLAPEPEVAQPTAKLDGAEAIDRAEAALPGARLVQPPTLQVYAGVGPQVSGPDARLAWFVWLIDERSNVSSEYVVDAVTGKVLKILTKADTARNRSVYNANHVCNGGTLVRTEGQGPTGNEDVDNAYNFTGDVYNFYSEWFGRDSYDNHGANLVSTAHFCPNFQNAYWSGERMIFGDHFASSVDVVGHELTHAVTEYSANLVYASQSGALNESFSDMMGETVEWFTTGKTDWRVGTNLPGGPFRNLKEPNEFSEMGGWPDPKNISEWWPGCGDNFGVHENSTITSHAYYLVASELGVPAAAGIFYRTLTVYLSPESTLEDARSGAIQSAADIYGVGSTQYNKVVAAFNAVGLNGVNQPPASVCSGSFECSFARAIEGGRSRGAVSGSEAVELLSTLYKARGQLAQGSPAGDHFLPLYENHMARITELVTDDPELAEESVAGLEELTPALEALMEGEGANFELTADQMARIEAALRRLAQDDRLYEGEDAGELADLIEGELEWMGLPSYGGMTYASGYQRLNKEVEAQVLSEETGEVIDPNCLGRPYHNDFHVNGFYTDTPGRRIPGQVSPVDAGGVICGTALEANGGVSGCTGSGTLNTEVTATLPPGDRVNSSKNLPNGSWVGETIGNALLCAGNETRRMYGQAGLLSLGSWTASQCPTTAVACYEGQSTFSNSEGSETGHGYAWVTESGGKLTLTLHPVTLKTQNGYHVEVGYGQFEVKLCARAGSSATQSCGASTAAWVHQNGTASEGGCPGGDGRFEIKAKNAAGETTTPASSCVLWQSGAHMQAVGAPNKLTAISCVPGTTTCVTTDSKGNAFYSTNVSAGAASTWTAWTGPGVSPVEAVSCPATTLCVVAAGEVSGGGGNVYRTSSLGGTWLNSFKPANGVGAVSCPTTTFCVSAQEGGGFIRYSTNPSGIIWTAISIGTGAIKDVACLSASFCAAVDGSGNVHVATSEKWVKEAAGWKATNIDGTTALRAITCAAATSCVAVDGSNEALKITVEAGGAATVARKAVAGAAELIDVTCNGSNCVAVDDVGGIFASTDAGATWQQRFDSASVATSVSCASATLCAGVDAAGEMVTFNPE